MKKNLVMVKGLLLILSFSMISGVALAEKASVWAESYQLEYKGKYKEAAALIESSLNSGGDTAEYAQLRYAWLNYLLGNYNDSIRSYKKAISLNPKSIDARLGLSLPLLAQQRWKEAAKSARDILKLAPWNFTAHLRLLISDEKQRKWDSMKKHALALAAHYPSSATPWVYLARAEAWKGDYKAAKRAYTRVIRRFPAHWEANAFLEKHQ